MDIETLEKLQLQLDRQAELIESSIERQRTTAWYVKIVIIMLVLILALLLF